MAFSRTTRVCIPKYRYTRLWERTVVNNRLNNALDGARTIFVVWPTEVPPKSHFRWYREREGNAFDRAWAKVGLSLAHACQEHTAELPEDERIRITAILAGTEERAAETERASRLFGEAEPIACYHGLALWESAAQSVESPAD